MRRFPIVVVMVVLAISIIAVFRHSCAQSPQVASRLCPFFDDSGIDLSMVAAKCIACKEGPRHSVSITFTISHVYAGTIAKDGENFEVICDDGPLGLASRPIWPVPKIGQRGVFTLRRYEGRLILRCGFEWFTNMMEDKERFAGYERLAADVEAYEQLTKGQRVKALKEYSRSDTDEVVRWALYVLARDFTDDFRPYARELAASDRCTIPQGIAIDGGLMGSDRESWPLSQLRKQLLTSWGRSRPSMHEAQSLAHYLDRQCQESFADIRAFIVQTCVSVASNKSMPVSDRVRLCESLGSLARQKGSAEALAGLRSIQASSDDSQIKASAAQQLSLAGP